MRLDATRVPLVASGRSFDIMKNISTLIIVLITCAGCSDMQANISSRSMHPTIPEGSIVTIDLSAYRNTPPERFDIVAFQPPEPTNALFVFRVIGLPGETILLQDDEVLIDGQPLELPDQLTYTPMPEGTNNFELGEEQYCLLGDNTLVANDSRFIGAINLTKIVGKIKKIEHGP